MPTTKPKIKINSIYTHPQKGVVVVHFETDYGYRTNVNIPPQQLEGLTQEEVQEHITRVLQNIYDERKRQTDTEKQKVKTAIKQLEGLEIK